MERGLSRRDPPRFPRPHGPCPQPVPFFRRHVGRMGRLRHHRHRRLPQRIRRRSGRRHRGRTGRGDELRRLPCPRQPLRHRGELERLPEPVQRPAHLPRLRCRYHLLRRYKSGGSGQPDRLWHSLHHAERRLEPSGFLHRSKLQPGQQPDDPRQPRHGHELPQPLATARLRRRANPERPSGQPDPNLHRFPLG